MTSPHRKLEDQVVVITGATSGIGLVTARQAAERGAKVVACARDADALTQLADEIDEGGGKAIAAPADVADHDALRAVAQRAADEFGHIDTWINNAGVSIYGRMEEVAPEDHRRLFETNFWGVVNGSLTAIDRMRGAGGVLINVGSVLSDFSIPLQGMYCASKHAVKGFTDSLRMEVEEAGLPIAVCLIKPSAIDTPYTTHARNYMGVKPRSPGPVYDPGLVAQAILHCAEHPKRELTVGGSGRVMSAGSAWLPRIADIFMERFMVGQQQTDEPAEHEHGSLHAPDNNMQERGEYEGRVHSHSMYTTARMHPGSTIAAALAASAAAAAGAWLTREWLHSPGPSRRGRRANGRSKSPGNGRSRAADDLHAAFARQPSATRRRRRSRRGSAATTMQTTGRARKSRRSRQRA